jgi:hypothetical protein
VPGLAGGKRSAGIEQRCTSPPRPAERLHRIGASAGDVADQNNRGGIGLLDGMAQRLDRSTGTQETTVPATMAKESADRFQAKSVLVTRAAAENDR